ncbi:ISSep1-like transposase [Bacillus thuringiensis serovar tochigiensis BGSC 4Y1]|nr:ISSep1-like transposase [Bacillus thuringiensis serovar tochigiensis BGSC 4Y1]
MILSVTSLFNHVLDDEEKELPQMFISTFIDFIFKKGFT